MTQDELVEMVALAILNSDRVAAGLPEVETRERIENSEGYVRNARAIIPIVQADQRERDAGIAEAEAAKHFTGEGEWAADNVAAAIRQQAEQGDGA